MSKESTEFKCNDCDVAEFEALVEYGSYFLRCAKCKNNLVATSWFTVGPELTSYIRVFDDGNADGDPLLEGIGPDIHAEIGELAATGRKLILLPA